MVCLLSVSIHGVTSSAEPQWWSSVLRGIRDKATTLMEVSCKAGRDLVPASSRTAPNN